MACDPPPAAVTGVDAPVAKRLGVAWQSRAPVRAHLPAAGLGVSIVFLQGYRTSFFGFPLPHWGWKEPFLNELFSDIHEASAITLAVLVGVHVLAAVAHAVRPGDHLFRRMLPRSLVR
jgi:cytochrome b561